MLWHFSLDWNISTILGSIVSKFGSQITFRINCFGTFLKNIRIFLMLYFMNQSLQKKLQKTNIRLFCNQRMPTQDADGGHTVAKLGKIGKLPSLSPKQQCQPLAMTLKNCKVNVNLYHPGCFDTRESFPRSKLIFAFDPVRCCFKSQFRRCRKAFGMTYLTRVIITYIGLVCIWVVQQGSVDILAYCCVNLFLLLVQKV